jgi:cytochrome c-type biogenesis protein CcmH/NrfG
VSSPRRSATRSGDTPGAGASDRRWRLEDQRDFLVRSLADLRTERDAGDIETRDFEALLSRDEGRLRTVEAELRELDIEEEEIEEEEEEASADAAPTGDAADAARRPAGRGRRRRWLGVVAIVALTAGSTLLVVHLASPRLPGQPETGSITESLAGQIQTQLAEASVLVDEGTRSSLSEALTVYRKVLSEDADQPQALAETGWLEWEAGFSATDASLEAKGKALVGRSLRVERDDYAAHLFLGTIELNQDHDPAAAVSQYQAFLAEHPPKALITSAAPLIRQAFDAVGQPVPAAAAG